MAALICLAVFLMEPICTVLFRIAFAMFQAIAGILRPATSPSAQRWQRFTSCVLLASLVLLGAGMAAWSAGIHLFGSELVWLIGALGLLISGTLGSYLEQLPDTQR